MIACLLEIDTDFFTIRYAASCPTDNEPMGCSGYSPFSLYVTEGLQNINWIVGSQGDSIEITTYTEDMAYLIDTKTTGIYASPDLEEGALGGLSMSKIPGDVGALTEFTFEFTTLNNVP